MESRFAAAANGEFFNKIGHKRTLTVRPDDARFTSKADI
jgi:hypothetical protein